MASSEYMQEYGYTVQELFDEINSQEQEEIQSCDTASDSV